MSLPRLAVIVGPSSHPRSEEIDPSFAQRLDGIVQLVSLEEAKNLAGSEPVLGIATLSHAVVTKQLCQELSPAKPLAIVVNYGVGVDHIDLKGLRELGIPVCNTPDVLSNATADMAWALVLACARRIPGCHDHCAQGRFTHYQNMFLLGRDVHHKTIGILGMGRIGTEVAYRAKGFHMNVLYHNRSHNQAAEEELGAVRVELNELLAQADVLVVTCPCTDETRNMLDKEALKLMKPTSILVNVARGPIINTEALLEALVGGTIDSAGLDVTDPEPLPTSHPLLSLDNVVLAPHRGSATVEARAAMVTLMTDNVKAAVERRALLTVCN